MVDKATDSGFGGKLASRITQLVAQGKVATTAGLAGHYQQVGALILDDFFKLTGSELRRTMGPLFTRMSATPGLDPDMANTLRFIGAGEGQFATLLGSAVIGTGVSTGVGALLSNTLQPATGRIIAQFPNLPISPADAAQAEARGLQHGLDMAYEVAQQGIDSDKFNVLVDLSRRKLDASALIDLVNRGLADESFATVYLRRLGFDVSDAGRVMELRRALHSPAILADLVTFGVLTEEQAAPEAAKSGMTASDFHLLVLGNGQPPAEGILLEAYRRGIIDHTRLLRGITQGPVRNEWFDVLEALRYEPMSTSDAIEAAVQGHISLEQSRSITQDNGLLPAHWQALYDTAGNPPGVQEMISMWHRGTLSRDELVQGIKESRLKNKYIDKVIEAGETLPPERTIVSLVGKGALTDQQGTDLLLRRGYAPDIVTALMLEAHQTKTADARQLSISQITSLYEQRAIDQQTALSMMDAVGEDPEAAGWLLALADARRQQAFTSAAITRIRAGYLAGRVDANQAATDMDSLRVPPDQRDELLALWDIEANTPSHALTEAQLRAAARAGIVTWDEYATRLVQSGYSVEDASILFTLYSPAPQQST